MRAANRPRARRRTVRTRSSTAETRHRRPCRAAATFTAPPIGPRITSAGPRGAVSAARSTTSRSGDSEHTGSVAAASPVSWNAWQRQPPKSTRLRRAAPARLLHPVRAAVSVERRWSRTRSRAAAGPRTFSISSVVITRRGRARQHVAVGRDRQLPRAPAVHARLRVRLVVVGDHVHDLHRARAAAAVAARHDRIGRGELFAAWASARRGCAAPSRSTGCWPAPAGRRPSARPAR